MTMYFGLSEEQEFFQETIGKFLEDESTIDAIKSFAKGDNPDFPEKIHAGLLDLGINGLIIPEEYGGLGENLLSAAAVSESLGAGVATSPFIGSYIMAPYAIMKTGSDKQKDKYLNGISDGSIKFGIGLTEFVASREGAHIEIESGKANGRALFVFDTNQATHFILSDLSGQLFIIDAKAKGLEIVELITVDKTSSFVELVIKDVEIEILGQASIDQNHTQEIVDLGRLMIAADSLGAAQVMINKSVSYSKERKQFGRLIGSFQAVKHMCAEMTANIEPCYSLIWYAAHCMNHIPDESRLMSSHSKAHVSEVASSIAKTATEVHGGMGFTDDLGLHYWFKRIGMNRQLLGGVDTVREEAAKAQDF